MHLWIITYKIIIRRIVSRHFTMEGMLFSINSRMLGSSLQCSVLQKETLAKEFVTPLTKSMVPSWALCLHKKTEVKIHPWTQMAAVAKKYIILRHWDNQKLKDKTVKMLLTKNQMKNNLWFCKIINLKNKNPKKRSRWSLSTSEKNLSFLT